MYGLLIVHEMQYSEPLFFLMEDRIRKLGGSPKSIENLEDLKKYTFEEESRTEKNPRDLLFDYSPPEEIQRYLEIKMKKGRKSIHRNRRNLITADFPSYRHREEFLTFARNLSLDENFRLLDIIAVWKEVEKGNYSLMNPDHYL